MARVIQASLQYEHNTSSATPESIPGLSLSLNTIEGEQVWMGINIPWIDAGNLSNPAHVEIGYKIDGGNYVPLSYITVSHGLVSGANLNFITPPLSNGSHTIQLYICTPNYTYNLKVAEGSTLTATQFTEEFQFANHTHTLDTNNQFSENQSRLLSVRDGGVERFSVDAQGNLHVTGDIIMHKPTNKEVIQVVEKEYKVISRMETLIIEENNDGTEV